MNSSQNTSSELIVQNQALKTEVDDLKKCLVCYGKEVDRLKAVIKRVCGDNKRMAIALREYVEQEFQDRDWFQLQAANAEYSWALEKYLHKSIEPDLDFEYFASVIRHRFEIQGNFDLLLFDPRMRNPSSSD